MMPNRHIWNELTLKVLYAARRVVKNSVTKMMLRHGLKPIGVVEVPVSELNVIRPVLCNEVNSSKRLVLSWYEDYFKDDWSIKNSMFCKLLRGFYSEDTASSDVRIRFREQDYWKMHEYMRTLGGHPRSEDWIERKIISFINLARDMDRRGYDYSRLSNYIVVLNEPMCKTRYGIVHSIDGYEVYTGHHRAACAQFLGMETLFVILAEDVAGATPFGVQFADLQPRKGNAAAVPGAMWVK